MRDGVAVNSLGKNRGPTQRRAFDGGSGVKVKLADEPGGKGNKRPQRGDQPPTRRGEGIRPRVSGDVSGQGTDSGGSKETTDIPKTGQEMAPAPWASKHTHRTTLGKSKYLVWNVPELGVRTVRGFVRRFTGWETDDFRVVRNRSRRHEHFDLYPPANCPVLGYKLSLIHI